MSPRDSYRLIFEELDIQLLLHAVSKKSWMGAPTQLNYQAMIYSLFVRIIERIPTIKDLRKRLKNSLEFRLDCGFTLSHRIPSETSYSRLIRKIQATSVLEEIEDPLVLQAFEEGFLDASAVAYDATRMEARDRGPQKKGTEKKVEAQLPLSYRELKQQIPLSPEWRELRKKSWTSTTIIF